MRLCDIKKLSAALTLCFVCASCDRPSPALDGDPVAPQTLQPNANELVEPHRYVRLGDLAGAIRTSGHGCEAVRTYKLIEQKDEENSVYKIDCLEYSFRLTISNGQGKIERWDSRDAKQKTL